MAHPTKKLSAADLQAALDGFTGTEAWHRWSLLFPHYTLTDGALFLAESAKAYWLMDAIASWQPQRPVRDNPFQVWILTRDGAGAWLRCEDGNNKILARQRVPYTDFPLASFKIYAISDEPGQLVILLPGEY